ncbi:MAG: tetratricopeptide repeat protein [Acidobacteriota bacterium]|nr:tetratricopeptide repeat protein [Acidobacteriota bacterium]
MRHLVVAVAALTLVSCSNNPNEVKAKYLEIGNKYFGRAKYKEASIYYRKAIAKDPKYGEAYYHYALTLLKQNAVANAVGPLRRAAELLPPNTPDSSDAKLQLAQILLMVSDSPSLVGRNQPLLDEVDQLSKGMLQGNPNSFEGHKVSADLLLAKGLELFRRKNVEDAGKVMQSAIAEYRKALEIKPRDVSATVPLARTLALTGKTADAEQLYLALIEKDKTHATPYKDLYRLYIGQNRNADAEKILQKEIANNPKDYGAKTDLATFYSATGNRAAMAKILDDLKANAKEFPAAYLTAADFYFRNGDGDEATKQLQQGIKNDPARKSEYEKRLVEVEIRQGKKEQAYQRNLQVLKDNPKDNDARGMKAAFLLDKGDINQAIGELQAVVTANPDNFVARFNLGRAHVAKGDFDRARQQFEKAVELRGDYIPARIALAQLALSRGDYTGALKNAQDLEQVNKNNAAARLIQASAYIRLNRFQEARPVLNQLLAEYPKQVDTLLEMGILDINEKHYDEALEMFRRAWAANPQNMKGILGEAETLLVTGKPDEAVKLIEGEVQKHPENGDLMKELANLEVRTGHYDQALAHFQSLAEKNKSNPRLYGDLLFRIAVVYRQKGDVGKSIATLYQAKDQVPDNALVLNQLALSLEQTGKHKEALQMYQKVIQNDPNDAEALNNLAFLMAETGGNLDEALTLANRAKQRLPDLWEISDTIGWIYLKKNLSDNAIELFREIVTRQPNNPIYHYHLAMAFTQKGDKAQAMKEAKLALDHKPSKEQEGQIKELIQKLA